MKGSVLMPRSEGDVMPVPEREPYWLDSNGRMCGGPTIPPGYKRCAYCSKIIPQAAHGMSCEEKCS